MLTRSELNTGNRGLSQTSKTDVCATRRDSAPHGYLGKPALKFNGALEALESGALESGLAEQTTILLKVLGAALNKR